MRGLSILSAALCIVACSELPGERVGTYRVTMALSENTCGAAAVNLLDKHRYSVELRRDEEHGYWRVPGKTPIQGAYDPPDFSFAFDAVVASSGPDAGPNACRLLQHDVLKGSIASALEDAATDAGEEQDAEDDLIDEESDPDAGSPPALEGTHVMTISGSPGSDCQTRALAPKGAFERLPCSVTYQLRGVPMKPF